MLETNPNVFLWASCLPFMSFLIVAFSWCLLCCWDTSLALSCQCHMVMIPKSFKRCYYFISVCPGASWCQGCCGQSYILLFIVGIVLLIAHTCLYSASEHIAKSATLIHGMVWGGFYFRALPDLYSVPACELFCFWKRWLPSWSSSPPILSSLSGKL